MREYVAVLVNGTQVMCRSFKRRCLVCGIKQGVAAYHRFEIADQRHATHIAFNFEQPPSERLKHTRLLLKPLFLSIGSARRWEQLHSIRSRSLLLRFFSAF